MPNWDDLQGPPPNTQWQSLNYLAEVARVATIEFNQEKRAVKPHRRLDLRFKFDGSINVTENNNKGDEQRLLDLPVKNRFNGQGFVTKKNDFKDNICNNLPGKKCYAAMIREPTAVKAQRESSKALDNKLKRPLELETDHEEKMKLKKQKKVINLRGSPNSCPVPKNEKKPKRCVKKNKTQQGSVPLPADLPPELKNLTEKMNGTDLTVVIRKTLTKTDVSMTHVRLSIPEKQVENDFLTREEKKIMDEYNDSSIQEKTDTSVVLIDPLLRKWDLKLRRWDMYSTSIYNLVSGWSKVLEANQLENGDVIQLLSFRSHSKLCFVLLVERTTRGEGSSGSSSGVTEAGTSGTDSNEASTSGTKDSDANGSIVENEATTTKSRDGEESCNDRNEENE